eukprot:SAG22_NODE_379_length_11417_cov_211.325647_6_plen_48_part_00
MSSLTAAALLAMAGAAAAQCDDKPGAEPVLGEIVGWIVVVGELPVSV